MATGFGRDVACNNDLRLRLNEPIPQCNQAMNPQRSARPNRLDTTCFIRRRFAARFSDATTYIKSSRYQYDASYRVVLSSQSECMYK